MEPSPTKALRPNLLDPRPTTGLDLSGIFGLVRDDFDAVNVMIADQVSSHVPLIRDVGNYMVQSGGKRIRPLVVLLSAKACGYRGEGHIPLATLVEFLHSATLLHDDVVDDSDLRRGSLTAKAKWNNSTSILVGDFIYSRAFQLMVSLENMRLMEVMSEATNIIAEGEVMQLVNIGNTELDELSYMEIIRRKTALLFQAAAHTASILSQAKEHQAHALREFGLHFGLAFQLMDDWLDYAGDSSVMGKSAGNDLAEGKVTLPLIHTLANGTKAEAKLVRRAIQFRAKDRLDAVLDAVRRSGSLDFTREQANRQVEQAVGLLARLPQSRYRRGLEALAHHIIDRVD